MGVTVAELQALAHDPATDVGDMIAAWHALERDPVAGRAALRELADAHGTELMPPTRPTTSWHNHQSTHTANPDRIFVPRTLADLQAIVAQARADKKEVRAYGTGHAYSDVATVAPGQYLVDTSQMDEVLPLPPLKAGRSAADYFHVEAGIKLRALNAALRFDQRAMANLGGYTGQSLAGATATGTHGSGVTLGNLAAGIVSMVVVTETGTFRIEPADGPTEPLGWREAGVDALIQADDVFRAVSVAMGSAGLVYSIVTRVLPRYKLKEHREVFPWKEVRALLEEGLVTRHRHVEIWVNPYIPRGRSDHRCLVISRDVTTEVPRGEAKHRSGLQAFAESSKLGTDAFAFFLNTFPDATPGILDATLAGLADETYIDESFKVLASDRTTDGWGCEIALSMRNDGWLEGIENVFALCAREAKEHKRYMGVLSLRFVAASTAFMAPQHDEAGHPTCMIEMDALGKTRGAAQLFRTIQRATIDGWTRADGNRDHARNHWGLEFDVLQGWADVARLYPRAGEWRDVILRLNPGAVFRGPFTRRIGL